MLLTYYTLEALAREWDAMLRGATVADAFSQNRSELSLALDGAGGGEGSTLVTVVRSELRLLFRNPGHGRARRNSATLFERAVGRRVDAVRTAERDRVVFVEVEGGLRFQIQLFGPRPNVWLVEDGGHVVEAFQAGEEWEGTEPPAPRAAPTVATFEDFSARWRSDRKSVAQSVQSAMPLFDRALAAEAVARSGVDTDSPDECTETERRALFDAAREVEERLADPWPRILWRGTRAEGFSLIDLHSAADGLRPELFDTVDEAVRVFARRSLAQQRFDALYRPVEQKLAAASERLRRSADRMLEELAKESRADTYERYGHLLMAQATQQRPGLVEVTLPDILTDGTPITVPLDEALSGVENAERYYDKARRTRAARAHAEGRWEGVQREAESAADLLTNLRAIERVPDLETFLEAERDALAAFTGRSGSDGSSEPFRRFALPGGYEAWVGKNAKGNAELTTRWARPHDFWLHARGVPGSHVVIRRDSKTERPDRRAIEQAAALAAYYSDARSQPLAPVIVTERKYIRPIKGGPPGAVRVDREEVVLVEPRRPDS